MSLSLRLHPRARADLDDIWAYTAETWGPLQARTYLAGLGAMFEMLRAYPDMARLRAEFLPPVRLHPYRSHLVVYRAEGGSLDVIRVLHQRADWRALLAE